MKKKRVLKPDPPTRTLTVKDVPSEVVDLFNSLCCVEKQNGKVKGQVLADLLLSGATNIYGKAAVELNMRCYSNTQKKLTILLREL